MFRIVTTQEEMNKAFAVRAIVFGEEQSCPWDVDFDGQDLSAVHVLGEIEGQPIATGRLRFLGEYVKLERLAVRKAFRGKDIGKKLLQTMLEAGAERGFTVFKLHAQVQTLDFYRKAGFEARGNPFLEAGIEHQLMVWQKRDLSDQTTTLSSQAPP